MSVVYFLLLVGVLVSVHELGHFVAAKALDVKVVRFSLGFGPAIARLRGRETEYQIGIVPLGGYVRLYGGDPGDPIDPSDEHRSFSAKPLWRRLVVVFAGPAANLLCPVVIYFAFFLGHTELPAAVIGDRFTGGPAAAAGLEPGDRVLEVNGAPIRYWEELEGVVNGSQGQSLRLRIRRGSHELSTYVTPRRYTLRSRNGLATDQGLIGVTQAPFQPQIGVLDAASAAARAGLRTGDLVISVGGEPIESWTQLQRQLARHSRRVPVAYLRGHRASWGFADVKVYEPQLADLVPDFLVGPDKKSRVETGLASAEFFVAAVEPGSPAAHAGLLPGDLITTLDGQPVTHWMLFDQRLQAEPDRVYRLGWQRARPGGGVEERSSELRQERRVVVDEYGHAYERLVFGATNDFRPGHGEMIPIDGRVRYAAAHAFRRTGRTIVEMVRGFASLIAGEAPRDTVGGPIMMYRIASVSGAKGWDYFLLMIALISINLGLLNLLPVPILDGGHLVVFAIEAVRRRRLSPRISEAVLLVGLLVIIGLTALALRNDIVRYIIPPRP